MLLTKLYPVAEYMCQEARLYGVCWPDEFYLATLPAIRTRFGVQTRGAISS